MSFGIKTIGLDHGYDSMKAYDGVKLISFQSKMEETKENINTNNTFKLEYENKTYYIGDGASQNYLEYDKTANDFNKILTLAALGRLMDDDIEEETFNIVAGYPLNIYSTNKNIFAKYLKSTNDVNFIFQNKPKKIHINDCIVFPQGAGALFINHQQYKDKIVAILDIGGLTINGCIFDKLNLMSSSKFTINQGCIILYNKLKNVLNNLYTLNIQEYEISNIIQNGLLINGEKKQETQDIIKEVLFEHCKLIKAECRRFNWNLETLEVIVTGGGAIVLDGYIQSIIPQAKIMPDPVFSNVKGFYEVGRHYYEKDI